MPLIVWILPAFAALVIAALPGVTAGGTLREAPVILAFILLGWAAQRSAIFTALALGLLLDCLGHLPVGTFMIPGLVLTLSVSLLRPWLRRGQTAGQFIVILVAAFSYTVVQPQWHAFMGLPAASLSWIPPLLAALLWLPFATLSAPADSAIGSDAAF